jgi:hypothetical protein
VVLLEGGLDLLGALLAAVPVEGEVLNKYNNKTDAKYTGRTDKPVESMMWKNKF